MADKVEVGPSTLRSVFAAKWHRHKRRLRGGAWRRGWASKTPKTPETTQPTIHRPKGIFEGGRCPVRRLSCGCAQVAAAEGQTLSALTVLIKA